MNILILLLFIFLIIIIFYNKKEKMTDIVPFTKEINSDLNKKCCLIEKKYVPVPDNNSLYGGNFKYNYTSLENEKCNIELYDVNNNKQLLIDGVNNWSNDNCSEKNTVLGSCRMINNECIDFVDKEFCSKIPGMVWSSKTCQNPLEYVWQDKITRSIPEKDKNDGSFEMFPEKFKKY